MGTLIRKKVDFNGDNLVAVKNNETNVIYVGVSYICKGIGLNKSQKDTQVQNVQSDLVLNKGCLKFQAGVLSNNNEAIGIDINYLPLWLAKISITPKMQDEQPEVVEKLVQYQLKAKDVLANAFIKKESSIDPTQLSPELQMFKTIFDTVAAQQLENKQIKQEINQTKEEVQNIRDVITLNPQAAWRRECNRILNAIGRELGDYTSPKAQVYEALKERAKCRPNVLISNLQKRARENGVCESKVKNLNILDVLENEPRLKDIYVNIVKEMAIKNNVSLKGVI